MVGERVSTDLCPLFPTICCFLNLFPPTIFGLGGVRCKLSPMLRQAEKRAPKSWGHLLGTTFTFSGFGYIELGL
jgi:hypothetical protein